MFECRDGHTMCFTVAFLWLPSDSFCVERVLSLLGLLALGLVKGVDHSGRSRGHIRSFARLLGIR